MPAPVPPTTLELLFLPRMTPSRPLAAQAWILALLAALLIILGSASFRVERIETVSQIGLGNSSATDAPRLLVPVHAQGSYEWLNQTAQAQETGAWRIRDVSYDNATAGRPTHLSSPYRWWLQTVAGATGGGLERAALWAGPLLQALALLVLAPLVARTFGGLAATLVAVAWAGFFPLNTAFLPGQPDDLGAKAALLLAHALCLLRGAQVSAEAPRKSLRLFIAAGALGGLGCWLHVASQLPLIGGVVLAAVVLRRTQPAVAQLPWRAWALTGGAVSLVAWLFEYAPARLGAAPLSVNHPLYALAWFAAADLLAGGSAFQARRLRTWLALAGIAAPVVAALATGGLGFPGAAGNVTQLSGLEQGIASAHLGAWLARDGVSAAALATFLAAVAGLVAALAGWRGAASREARVALGLVLGPLVILAGLGLFRLYAWNLFAAALPAVLVAAVAAARATPARALVAATVLAACLPGVWLAWPRGGSDREVSADEVEALVARDLARSLARRAPEPGAVVLAPPALTSALIHYGGLRGVGTAYWENHDGLAAAVRILGASSTDEALALAQRREVRFVVLPSWDSTLEDLARLAADDFDRSLAGLLRQWLPPRWLRPVPYALPGIAGLETRAVMIFEVVEAQDNATALARLAEYFLEMGQPQLAGPVAAALKQAFPTELAALAGRLHVEMAQRDTPAVNATVAAIKTQLDLKADEILPWERRVSLALALAQARQLPLARPLLAFSLETIDEDHLRSLTAGTLYRLLAVARAADLSWPDDSLRTDALALLPPEWRERL